MPEKVAPDTSKLLLCPMPGLVVSIAVAEGQEVKAGETLAVVEAMKMENVLRAERDLDRRQTQRQAGRQPGRRCGDHGVRLKLHEAVQPAAVCAGLASPGPGQYIAMTQDSFGQRTKTMADDRLPRDPLKREAWRWRPRGRRRRRGPSSICACIRPIRCSKAPCSSARSSATRSRTKRPAIAVTDTNNLFGALEFAQKAVKDGIQPIIGCQIDLAFSGENQRRPARLAGGRARRCGRSC